MSDRPLYRSLIKTGTRLLLGNARAHFQDGFPGLRIVRAANGQQGIVRYRRKIVAKLVSAATLRARAGKEIFIVGSGPSIAQNDLSRLPPSSAILLNGAMSLLGGPIEKALAVAVEDERFVWRHFDLMRQAITGDTVCLFSVEVLRAICEVDVAFLSDKTVVLIDDVRKPFFRRRRRYAFIQALEFIRRDADIDAGISLDPDRGVFRGGSVAVSALQFAFYCAPKAIGLFGIDISNAHQPRFYENQATRAPSGIAGAQERILAHFSLAKRIAGERDVELLNFSPVSALIGIGLDYDDRFSPSKAA